MNTGIAGYGLITPLGADPDIVWQRLQEGNVPEIKTCANPESGRLHRYIPIPPKLVESLARNPRLRRSSGISYFACAAGLAALAAAGVEITRATAARTALVFAITDGGVIYTRKFYEQIVKTGARSASPVLFPETVYNAPASHLAAQLGIDGASYTLVGDASVGMSALHFGAQLLASTDIDRCVVVGAEECDWILCEAYDQWRLARTPLAEGAAALVLTREADLEITTDAGAAFFRQRNAFAALSRVLTRVADGRRVDLLVRCANHSFIDAAETRALAPYAATAKALEPKRAFGEAPGASALLQVVIAALAVRKQFARCALVPVIGFNHQAGGALLVRRDN